MLLLKRCFIFTCGLFFVALGISCAVTSKLGTATISSVPYVLNLRYPISLGTVTFVFNMLFFLGQILILRRRFQLIQILQILVAGVFGFFIDFTMTFITKVTPEMYASQLVMAIVGIHCMAFGIALQLIGNLVMVPGDGIVKAIAAHWHLGFGVTKTYFDVSCVLIAIMLSRFYFGEIYGVREGTLLYALFTGVIAQFFVKHLKMKKQF